MNQSKQSSDESSGREQQIDAIIVRYLLRLEAGEQQKSCREAIAAQNPSFEKALRTHFENEDMFMFRPDFGDDYEDVEEIGRGGMGIVYRAYQKRLKRTVAIKTIKEGNFAIGADVERFLKEAQRAAGLRHPQIVTVYQVAEHQGQHFFVMDFIDGQSLAELIRKGGPLPSAKAAQYVRTIAEAIHYAHQRQILHCDLKPANILLDGDGRPYVTDFGLAKRLVENARSGSEAVRSGPGGGSPVYMAPEQAMAAMPRGDPSQDELTTATDVHVPVAMDPTSAAATGHELTTATDVYGLGAILYELLTGSAPFHGEALQQTLKRVAYDPPDPPSERSPNIDKDLEAICLKCLSKDKDQRYGSAYGLAMDLGRYQAREETTARQWRRKESAVRSCHRNPVATGLISGVGLISILTVIMAVAVYQAGTEALIQTALRSNSSAAKNLARTALLQVWDLSHAIEGAAGETTLSELLALADHAGLQRYLEQTCRGESIPFASCSVMDGAGVQVARVGEVEAELTQERFNWRDYFEGARAHTGLQGRRSIHLSRVYRSRNDDLYKFAMSVPILDAKAEFIGVLVAGVTTDAVFVPDDDNRRRVVLAAPEDINGPVVDGELHRGHAVILFHPAYRRGDTAVETASMVPNMNWVHAEELDDSRLSLDPDDNYEDPVGTQHADYSGRWIAGFAPVGNTGFVMVVQQRYEEALALDPSTERNLVLWCVFVILLAIMIVAFVLWPWPRRSATDTHKL